MAMDMNRMMKQARKMQAQMEQAQAELREHEYTATAGGGAVKAVVKGDNRVVSIEIDPEAIDPEDIEILQDMIVAAINDGLSQVEKEAGDAIGSLTGGMNIPGLF